MQWGRLIMGEHGCAAASLWLEHVPSIGLAIGPRHICLSVCVYVGKKLGSCVGR